MFQSANCDVVVGDAARHAGQAEEVLREEQHVHEIVDSQKCHLAQLLVVHVPVHFGSQ
jgi:hypothetical protein